MNQKCEIGYHASHEQFSPSHLINLVQMAEKAGFTTINSSDHFHPWSEVQGQSGFSFSWLGAAMQATHASYGMVCAPGQRYHPTIIAQAISTLSEMFPERFWISLGSGEAVNECINGEPWPEKHERNLRLLECVDVMRRLLAGETVNHQGRVKVENAKLYTLPKVLPKLVGAAVTAKTAEWMGSWADGLITVSRPYDELKKVIEAFRQGGGEGKPIYLKVQLSYAKSEEEALSGAYEQWKTNVLPSHLLSDLKKVSHFEDAATFVKPQDMKEMVHISSSLSEHKDFIKQFLPLGFDKIFLHNVNLQQELFINDFGEKVLNAFK